MQDFVVSVKWDICPSDYIKRIRIIELGDKVHYYPVTYDP